MRARGVGHGAPFALYRPRQALRLARAGMLARREDASCSNCRRTAAMIIPRSRRAATIPGRAASGSPSMSRSISSISPSAPGAAPIRPIAAARRRRAIMPGAIMACGSACSACSACSTSSSCPRPSCSTASSARTIPRSSSASRRAATTWSGHGRTNAEELVGLVGARRGAPHRRDDRDDRRSISACARPAGWGRARPRPASRPIS